MRDPVAAGPGPRLLLGRLHLDKRGPVLGAWMPTGTYSHPSSPYAHGAVRSWSAEPRPAYSVGTGALACQRHIQPLWITEVHVDYRAVRRG